MLEKKVRGTGEERDIGPRGIQLCTRECAEGERAEGESKRKSERPRKRERGIGPQEIQLRTQQISFFAPARITEYILETQEN